jgi:hypothetical protein
VIRGHEELYEHRLDSISESVERRNVGVLPEAVRAGPPFNPDRDQMRWGERKEKLKIPSFDHWVHA